MSKSSGTTEHAAFIEETRLFWSKRAGIEFTTEEAKEMSERMYEFISILVRWDKQSKSVLTSKTSVKSVLDRDHPCR